MQKHVNFLGLLFILYSLVGLVGALLIVVFFSGVGFLTGDLSGMTTMAIIGAAIASVSVISALPGIVAGLGLRAHKGWARYLAMILGVLSILVFPFGTLLGIYTLYVLLHNDTPRVFMRRSRRGARRRRATA